MGYIIYPDDKGILIWIMNQSRSLLIMCELRLLAELLVDRHSPRAYQSKFNDLCLSIRCVYEHIHFSVLLKLWFCGYKFKTSLLAESH